MTVPSPQNAHDILVEPITNAADMLPAFLCAANGFGHQTHDAMWMAMSPGWDTPSGALSCSERLIKQWRNATYNSAGDPNTVFVKATLPDPNDSGKRVIAGFAIWVQWSFVEGMGDRPTTDADDVMDLEQLYPGDEEAQRFVRQGWVALTKQRVEAVREKATTDSPATFSLDLCAVDPKFQRRGIASKLVEWGLNEARRRGGLESTTEGSQMGRLVYEKLGYKPIREGSFEGMDAEFVSRMPSNMFMRTGVLS